MRSLCTINKNTLLDILKNREARAEKRDRFRFKNNEIPSFATISIHCQKTQTADNQPACQGTQAGSYKF